MFDVSELSLRSLGPKTAAAVNPDVGVPASLSCGFGRLFSGDLDPLTGPSRSSPIGQG